MSRPKFAVRFRAAACIATATATFAAVCAAGPANAAPTSQLTIPRDALERGVVHAPGSQRTLEVADRSLSQDRSARTFTTFKVINVTRTDNAVGAKTIAKCVAATDGGTCNIDAGVSVQATVGVSLGATVQMVSAGLNASVATTVSLKVGCSSPVMKAGQSWSAHPVGTAYTYRIQKRSLFTGTTTSRTLSAFIPHANGIACGISS